MATPRLQRSARHARTGQRWAALLILLLVGIVASGCGDSAPGEPDASSIAAAAETSTPTVDTAALQASVATARQAFWTEAQRYSTEFLRCNDKTDDKVRNACQASKRHERQFTRAITSATATMADAPEALNQLEPGAGDTCQKALGRWEDDAYVWLDRLRLLDTVEREEGFPEVVAENRRYAGAYLAYYRALAAGKPAREEANRFAVLVACSTTDDAQKSALETASQFIDDYYRSYYESYDQDAVYRLCYATEGGKYYEGSDTETTIKTCIARKTDGAKIYGPLKHLRASFAALKALPGWASQTRACKRALNTAISTSRADARQTAAYIEADATNVSDSERDKAFDRYGEIDYAAKARSEEQMPSCLWALAAPT